MKLLPHVVPQMLDVAYWLDRIEDSDRLLLDDAGIAAFNVHVRDTIGYPDILELSDVVAMEAILEYLSVDTQKTYYTVMGTPFLDTRWTTILANMAIDEMPAQMRARFGLVAQRTHVRLVPTPSPALEAPGDYLLDRFQETTIDIGWPIAALHTSLDQAWFLALTPFGLGWVRVDHIALTEDRQMIHEYVTSESFLVVTAPSAGIARADGNHNQAQTGTRFPVVDRDATAYRLSLPYRNPDGNLILIEGYVAANDPAWWEGYAHPTLRSVLSAAFAMLGERYAWGGDRLGAFGRDCSRLVRDVWAITGVKLPRNSGQQERVGVAVAEFDANDSNDKRLQVLRDDVPPGALLFLPGHVLIYLGTVDGIPYAISDLWNYRHPGGQVTTAGEVIVSALPVEPSAERHTLLEQLTSARIAQAP